jgi:hypothetical protein
MRFVHIGLDSEISLIIIQVFDNADASDPTHSVLSKASLPFLFLPYPKFCLGSLPNHPERMRRKGRAGGDRQRCQSHRTGKRSFLLLLCLSYAFTGMVER